MNLSVRLLVLMANVLRQIYAPVIVDMLVKHVNILKVYLQYNFFYLFIFLSLLELVLVDPRLVQCFRRSDCSVSSRISNKSVSLSYCCGDQAGVAVISADGTCKPCGASDEEIANVSLKIHQTLNYATCILWGRDHIRTFDGLFYEFIGA